MEKRMMFSLAALAIVAVAALSVASAYANPSALSALTPATGDCDQDILQARLRTQDRDCDGTCNGTMTQNRAQAQLSNGNGTGCSSHQVRLMQQSCECLSLGGQAEQSAIQVRNQMMAQNCNNRP